MTHDVTSDGKLSLSADTKADAFELAELQSKLQSAGADYQLERDGDEVRLVARLGMRSGPKPRGKREKAGEPAGETPAVFAAARYDAASPRPPVSPPANGNVLDPATEDRP
jgi:hypothetical protein